MPESGSEARRTGAELRAALEQDEAREGSSLLEPRLRGRLWKEHSRTMGRGLCALRYRTPPPAPAPRKPSTAYNEG